MMARKCIKRFEWLNHKKVKRTVKTDNTDRLFMNQNIKGKVEDMKQNGVSSFKRLCIGF